MDRARVARDLMRGSIKLMFDLERSGEKDSEIYEFFPEFTRAVVELLCRISSFTGEVEDYL
jgi:hypothetical protein